jgi:hypothetical protein
MRFSTGGVLSVLAVPTLSSFGDFSQVAQVETHNVVLIYSLYINYFI